MSWVSVSPCVQVFVSLCLSVSRTNFETFPRRRETDVKGQSSGLAVGTVHRKVCARLCVSLIVFVWVYLNMCELPVCSIIQDFKFQLLPPDSSSLVARWRKSLA